MSRLIRCRRMVHLSTIPQYAAIYFSHACGSTWRVALENQASVIYLFFLLFFYFICDDDGDPSAT